MPPFSVAGPSIEFLNHQITWHQLSSIICLLQKISTVVHSVFFGILLIYLMKEILFFLCKNRLKVSEKEDPLIDQLQQPTSDVRLNLSSIATMFCSMILLGTHLTLLSLLLINGIDEETAPCTISIIPPLLSESFQVMSWAIVTTATYRILMINKCLKFPGILRLWWLCSFFFSAIPEALSTVFFFFFTLENHKSLLDFAAGLIIVAASTCLLFSGAIRAKTGTVDVIRGSNSLNEPLLINGKTDKKIYSTTKGKGIVRESLYANSTLIQLVTFSWLNPLFVAGKKKPLEQDEIPDVDRKDSARILSDSLDESLKSCIREKEDGRSTTLTPVTSFYRAILLFIGKKAMINALFAVISAFSSYVGPYLINDFVIFLSDKHKNQKSLKPGYLLALGFLGAKMIETVAQRQWIFGARQLGLRLRAALISHIYKKGLVLSTQSRQSHTSGEIINYMSVDIQRITDFSWYLNIIWMLPIQISLAIYILHTNLGLGASLAGLAATLLVMSCNVPLTRAQKRYQSKIMESKDARMKATSEVLRNIKTIKLQAWDSQFLEKLESLRRMEFNWIWKSLRLGAVGAFIFWGSPTFISVVTFGACIMMGVPLTAGRVLAALATFRMLQDPIFSLPDLLNVIAQAKVSVDRVASYLQEEEIQRDAIELVPSEDHSTPYAIDIDGGRFGWETPSLMSSRPPTLDDIQLKIKRGMKVAVCGTVGSGKSSLLSGIIGEIRKLSGSVKISGSKAYVPQSPWILTGNIRENILFGNAYDGAKYERTVKACALEKDLELFSYGDLTEIGERGITMSGGQKQRIQIARAVYHDADIYLLDDPFSAVDALTGSQLFQDCLMGILKDKTILFVTHQVEFLPAADLILVMENGRIAQAGSFKELLEQNIGFENLVGAHSQALETVLLTVEGSSRSSFSSHDHAPLDQLDSAADHESTNKLYNISTSSNLDSSAKNVPQDDEITEQLAGRLIQDEEREKGSIGKEVYWSYLTIARGGLLVPFIILAQSSFQVLQIASNYWMAWACPTKLDDDSKPIGSGRMRYILLIYTLLSVAGSLCVLVRATLVAKAGVLTAQKLFTNMLRSLFGAPMAFFDSTPTGRILNRASSDQSVLDLEMANRVGWAAFSIIQLVGTIAVMSQVAWEVFIIFIPVTAICIWYKQYYIPTARELARVAEIQKAPILHHFAESLAGAATIRAFDQEARFTNANLELVDGHSRPWFHNVAAMEWLSFRLNQLSNFVFAFSLLLLVSLPEGIINPSIAGLAVTYGINLNVLQASVIWNICNMENKIISVERILQYSNLKRERPLVIHDSRPPHNWPTEGTISFINLQVRYAEYLPAVLKNISCTFPGRKKIGVVGRTGSGKSTLIQAIFRIVEPTQGSIVIDNVDICSIGLHDLRSRLSVIPQDPTMFEGTVRGNVDPLQHYSDTEIWQALDKCQLGDLVRAKEGKLQSAVVENGENWSVGQRQLFCLARALLKRSSILILDEATASMDSATDGLIQKVISQEFQDRTIITIAHRIHTVINSDLVLVLNEGRIAEYDSPSGLLRKENSVFSRLIKEYSTRSQSFSFARLEAV